jgi:heme A synthase
MDYATYKLLHLIGLLLLFAALGGIAYGQRNAAGKPPAITTILHGVGLVIMLVAGFGLLARLYGGDTPWSAPWLIGKLVIWFVIGALPILARRKVVPPVASLWLALVLGGVAAWLAINKPTFG